jgi:hypothetical protein
MRYEVYTINGLHGVARGYKGVMALVSSGLPVNTGGKFAVLIKERKNAYPHSGMQGERGSVYKHTMLLYPPNAKCKQYTPEEYLAEAFR